MVRVISFGKRGFYAAGHAGSAPYGQDIVCAAVSVLTQSAYLALKTYGIGCRFHRDDERGVLCVLISDPGALHVQADAILTYLYQGLAAIEKEYPQFLHITPQTEVET